MKKIPICIVFLFYSLFAIGQTQEDILRSGNEKYRKGEYEKAEADYKNASNDPRAKYNLGNAFYKQNKIKEAGTVYAEISSPGHNTEIRSKAYYNNGVLLTEQKKLEESIVAYKNTLRLEPNDKEARENLQKALLELRKKNPPKEKKQNPPKRPPPQPKMNPKQAEQKLKQLQQKEKETMERLQKKQPVSMQPKDW